MMPCAKITRCPNPLIMNLCSPQSALYHHFYLMHSDFLSPFLIIKLNDSPNLILWDACMHFISILVHTHLINIHKYTVFPSIFMRSRTYIIASALTISLSNVHVHFISTPVPMCLINIHEYTHNHPINIHEINLPIIMASARPISFCGKCTFISSPSKSAL